MFTRWTTGEKEKIVSTKIPDENYITAIKIYTNLTGKECTVVTPDGFYMKKQGSDKEKIDGGDCEVYNLYYYGEAMDMQYNLTNVYQYFTTTSTFKNLLFGVKESEENYKSHYTLYFKTDGKEKEKLAEDVIQAKLSSDEKIVNCISGGALKQLTLDAGGKLKGHG